MKHREGIYRFLSAHGLPPAVAQEVTQDIFIKLFIAIRDGNGVMSPQGWLYDVAAKSAVSYWRREGRPIWIELVPDSALAETLRSSGPTPEVLAARNQKLRR